MTESTPWKVKDTKDPELIQSLVETLNIRPVTAKVLTHRRISSVEQASSFLHTDLSAIHDPFLLKDMDVAAQRVVKAVLLGERVCIYGDYDVDGAVGTSLLVLFFQAIGVGVDFYIPNRLTEGYSMNLAAVDTLKKRGTQLIITVDNGIMANDCVDKAQSLGIDVVVTDHHQVGEVLPQAVAVVNPQRKDCPYPFKGICGAGVAFKLMMAVRLKLREENHFKNKPEPNLKSFLDLLAVATVCDMVPLVDENRYFVSEGLKHLQQTKNVGLKSLLKVAGVDGEKPLNTGDVGFKIGPRINACGRLENAALGVELLTTPSLQKAKEVAKVLNSLNQDRRDIELEIVEEAFDKINSEFDLNHSLGVVVYEPDWHVGVVGIVASRLVEKIKRPVFVLCQNDEGIIKGSGRSVGSVSLIEALRECSQFLIQFGGHEAAAGLSLEPSQLSAFSQGFDQAIKKQMTPGDLQQTVLVDEDLTKEKIDRRLVDELSRLEPYGMGNAKPVFVARDLKVISKKIVGEHHLKLVIDSPKGPIPAIAFRQAQNFESVESCEGALFSLELNRYGNREEVQMVIREFF